MQRAVRLVARERTLLRECFKSAASDALSRRLKLEPLKRDLNGDAAAAARLR